MDNNLPIPIIILIVMLLGMLVFTIGSAHGQYKGEQIGRCDATCSSLKLQYSGTDGNACWCAGQEQPIKALGS